MPEPPMTEEMVMLDSLSHEFQMSNIRELHLNNRRGRGRDRGSGQRGQ